MSRLPEATRIARVLDIIWRISAAPSYWTRRRLAEEFEVSERSITSDLELIRHRLRFELHSQRGQGYYFTSMPKLPSVSYSVPEALALILAGQAGRQFAGISQHDLSAALARLASVIPGELRVMVDRFAAEQATVRDQRREAVLAMFGQATALSHSVDMVYEAASRDGEETRRRIDPYAVFPYGKSWHVVGHCHLRDDLRVFKIDRVRSVSHSGLAFSPPEEFDLGTYLSSGWGLMRGLDTPVEDVVLVFRPPSARWVAEEQWHPSQRIEQLGDDAIRFTVTIQVTPEFQRWVYHYGRDVEVVEPTHLRDWIRGEALAVLEGTRV